MTTLQIPYQIWQQLMCYVKARAPYEVTGTGTVELLNDRQDLLVKSIILPYQQVNEAFSEFNKGEFGRITHEFLMSDLAHASEIAQQLCLRWHSHGKGKVFWSTHDEYDISTWKGDYVVNIVTNVKGEYKARLDIFRPVRVQNIPLEIEITFPPLSAADVERYTAEVLSKAKVIPLKKQGGLRPYENDIF